MVHNPIGSKDLKPIFVENKCERYRNEKCVSAQMNECNEEIKIWLCVIVRDEINAFYFVWNLNVHERDCKNWKENANQQDFQFQVFSQSHHDSYRHLMQLFWS